MVEIAPDDDRLAWKGLVDLVQDGEWWQPWRLPTGRIETVHAPELVIRAKMPAGVRIAVQTDATGLAVPIEGDAESCPLDVLVDGTIAERIPISPGRNLVEVSLPPGDKHVELWLPQHGQTRIGTLTFSGETSVSPAPGEGPLWTTYGSSITQCRAADGPSETWPALVSRQNDWQLTCLGFGGECHLDPIVARTIRDRPADLISLCLGINMYGRGSFHPRTFAASISGFIELVREGKPETPIVVITPIISPEREHTPNLVGMTLARMRGDVVTAVEALIRLGDTNLHLVDGLEVLGEGDVDLLHDGLHPSADGYRLMADRLAPLLKGVYTGERPRAGSRVR